MIDGSCRLLKAVLPNRMPFVWHNVAFGRLPAPTSFHRAYRLSSDFGASASLPGGHRHRRMANSRGIGQMQILTRCVAIAALATAMTLMSFQMANAQSGRIVPNRACCKAQTVICNGWCAANRDTTGCYNSCSNRRKVCNRTGHYGWKALKPGRTRRCYRR